MPFLTLTKGLPRKFADCVFVLINSVLLNLFCVYIGTDKGTPVPLWTGPCLSVPSWCPSVPIVVSVCLVMVSICPDYGVHLSVVLSICPVMVSICPVVLSICPVMVSICPVVLSICPDCGVHLSRSVVHLSRLWCPSVPVVLSICPVVLSICPVMVSLCPVMVSICPDCGVHLPRHSVHLSRHGVHLSRSCCPSVPSWCPSVPAVLSICPVMVSICPVMVSICRGRGVCIALGGYTLYRTSCAALFLFSVPWPPNMWAASLQTWTTSLSLRCFIKDLDKNCTEELKDVTRHLHERVGQNLHYADSLKSWKNFSRHID